MWEQRSELGVVWASPCAVIQILQILQSYPEAKKTETLKFRLHSGHKRGECHEKATKTEGI